MKEPEGPKGGEGTRKKNLPDLQYLETTFKGQGRKKVITLKAEGRG